MARIVAESVDRSELALWHLLDELDDDFSATRLAESAQGDVVISICRGERSLVLVALSLSAEPGAPNEAARALSARLSTLPDLLAGSDASAHAGPGLVLLRGLSDADSARVGRAVHDRLGFSTCTESELVTRLRAFTAGTSARAEAGAQAREPRPYAQRSRSDSPRQLVLRDNSARYAHAYLDEAQQRAATVDLGESLPPEQQALVEQLRVRLVTGVAGAGKTLIAKYRAQLLATAHRKAKILFLCNNTPLAATVHAELKREAPQAAVDVRTFSSWAWRYRDYAGRGLRLETYAERADFVSTRRTDFGVPARITTSELMQELDFIADQLLESLDAYQGVKRVGRGFGLTKQERSQVWSLHRAHRDSLCARQKTTHSELVRSLCQIPQAGPAMRVDYVLVDEAQFFSKARFELLQRAMAPGGHLFLCADPDQGFLGHGASWKSLGVVLGHRTQKLRRSYRTTRAILAAARSMLPELGAGDDGEDCAEPDFSHMQEGKPPQVLFAASPRDAIDRLVNELVVLTRGGLALHDVLVLHGDQIDGALLHGALKRRLGAERVWWMNHPDQKRAPPAGTHGTPLRLASVRTATGLESRVVFLLGMEALWSAVCDSSVPATLGGETSRQRLLYMAMTRAAQTLVLVTFERPPALRPPLFALES